jgi:hypothetical protein
MKIGKKERKKETLSKKKNEKAMKRKRNNESKYNIRFCS